MQLKSRSLSFKQQLKVVAMLAIFVAVPELVNLFSGSWLVQFGLHPREISHLLGIFTAPFLHSSLIHFLSNILPLCIFAFLVLQHGFERFIWVTLWIITVSGLLVWVFGRDAMHVGASGLVYGYFGFLILAGFVARKFKLIAISCAVGIIYGGLIFGVLPNLRPYISWEYHLFGFISGLLAAWFWAGEGKGKKSKN